MASTPPSPECAPWKGRFAGHVAIVTGASHGIGLAVALELLREGASVVASALPQDEAEGRAAFAAAGFSPLLVPGDLSQEAACQALVEQALAAHGGRLTLLVNNAFSFLSKGEDATRADWERSFAVGPMAFAQLLALCAGPMQRAGGGAVVNVSSISAWVAQPHRWTYNSAKGAVTQLTRCAALDLCVASGQASGRAGQQSGPLLGYCCPPTSTAEAWRSEPRAAAPAPALLTPPLLHYSTSPSRSAPKGIRVNSVSPGWTWTREVDKACGGDRASREKAWGSYAMLQRLAYPVEIARPVLFLLSSDASFITGTDLAVDGGYRALGPEGLDGGMPR
jgi:NAD(P)-dependent dehydrogenase (short-subunit alcohol dehydrogenase family)